MKKQKIIRYLQSIIAIPMLAVAMPLSGVSSILDQTIIPLSVTEENSAITTQEEVNRKQKADLIDSFFKKNNAPLEGYGMKFVLEAEKNNLDWRLLPSIAMRETTGGKFSCKNPKAPNNNFGWGSCKIGFESVDQSIEFISMTLSGNNPNSKYYKTGMTTEQILKKYNPDHIIPGYSKQVMKIMEMINLTSEI
ncbi:MAG: hypothetical protein PHT84_03155 [Candidatus Pacebacteria bacterium]|nr:hypothetical protein [Candidatus Paceibacterota bacterium]